MAKSVGELFAEETKKPDSELDLARAALLIAKHEYPSLEVDRYIERLDSISYSIEERLHEKRGRGNERFIIDRINARLFGELSFRGNVENYYDPKNSFLNEVLDRRTG